MLKAKKVLALGLTMAMLSTLVTGCGNSTSQSSSESSKSEEVPGSTAAVESTEAAYVPSYPIVDEPITVTAVVLN